MCGRGDATDLFKEMLMSHEIPLLGPSAALEGSDPHVTLPGGGLLCREGAPEAGCGHPTQLCRRAVGSTLRLAAAHPLLPARLLSPDPSPSPFFLGLHWNCPGKGHFSQGYVHVHLTIYMTKRACELSLAGARLTGSAGLCSLCTNCSPGLNRCSRQPGGLTVLNEGRTVKVTSSISSKNLFILCYIRSGFEPFLYSAGLPHATLCLVLSKSLTLGQAERAQATQGTNVAFSSKASQNSTSVLGREGHPPPGITCPRASCNMVGSDLGSELGGLGMGEGTPVLGRSLQVQRQPQKTPPQSCG